MINNISAFAFRHLIGITKRLFPVEPNGELNVDH